MKALFFVFAALLVLAPGTACPGDVTFLTHNLGNQTYRHKTTDELRGLLHAGKRAFNLELVRELKRMLHDTGKIEEVTFARGLDLVENGHDMALFNVYRTTERENRFKWVGPLQREVSYLYGLVQFGRIENQEAARQVGAICVAEGSLYHSTLVEREFQNIVTAETYAECFAQLKAGQVNLTAATEESLPQNLQDSDIPFIEAYQVPGILTESAGYIAFSPNTDISVIQRWQEAFNTLVGSGTYQQLYDLYYSK